MSPDATSLSENLATPGQFFQDLSDTEDHENHGITENPADRCRICQDQNYSPLADSTLGIALVNYIKVRPLEQNKYR